MMRRVVHAQSHRAVLAAARQFEPKHVRPEAQPLFMCGRCKTDVAQACNHITVSGVLVPSNRPPNCFAKGSVNR